MKKNKILICLFFLSYIICNSQQCLSNEYLESYKNADPFLESKIKSTISKFIKQRESDLKLPTQKTLPSEKGVVINPNIGPFEPTITIPVVFNVIHNGEFEGSGRNLSNGKIQEQIDLMNSAYSGAFGGVDTKIQFCLAQKNSLGQTTTGINRFLGAASYDSGQLIGSFCAPSSTLLVNNDNLIKGFNSTGFPSNLYLNIWTTDLKLCGNDVGLAGYSSFPYYLDTLEELNNFRDGIVVDYKYVGTNSETNSYGMTAVHEVGHWLGLFHIFEDNDSTACNSNSFSCHLEEDLICDTESVPDQGTFNIAPGDCLGYDCNGQTTTVVQNFMDYQSSARQYCSRSFTQGQNERMRDILSFYRPAINNQGAFGSISCGVNIIGGGSGGSSCQENLPVQKIFPPNNGQSSQDRKFGDRLEVNDKWLITIDSPFYMHIYKREGCLYALHQSIQLTMPYSYSSGSDFGLILNDNEIIISTYQTDSAYVYRLNESSGTWYLNQHLQNNSSSDVGTSTYIVGDFLFILESNPNANNVYRIYHKNNIGNYSFHQTLSVSGFNLPSVEKCIQSGNFVENEISINSSNFTETYDPPELLVSKYYGGGTDFVLLGLNNSNQWTTLNYIQPNGISSSERIYDIEISKDFIYVLTSKQLGEVGSGNDILYAYSYRINKNNTNPFNPFDYNRHTLLEWTNGFFSGYEMEIFNDQFLFVDKIKWLFYNQNFSSTNLSLPSWNLKKGPFACINDGPLDKEEFELFGNLLFYGVNDVIRIFDMKDVLDDVNYSSYFINNSDFFNKKICTIPNDYSMFSEKITIGESCEISFNNAKKEFVAKELITLKSGTTISRGSDVTLRISNSCNSIIPSSSKTSNTKIISKIERPIQFKSEDLDIKEEDEIIIYPNPTTSLSTVQNLNEVQLKSLEVYNITDPSRLLISERNFSEDQTLSINLNRFITGVYVIKIVLENNKVIYKKIIKK